MPRLFAVRGLVALLLLGLTPMIALGQAPPGPTTRHSIRVDGLPVAAPADVLAFIVEFPPGAETPPHTHPGLVVATTLEGEATLITGGVENTYKSRRGLDRAAGRGGRGPQPRHGAGARDWEHG